jgi:hypothetical protein
VRLQDIIPAPYRRRRGSATGSSRRTCYRDLRQTSQHICERGCNPRTSCPRAVRPGIQCSHSRGSGCRLFRPYPVS